MFYSEIVEEHGQWCLARCLGKKTAEQSAVPPSSVPIYAANEARILATMEANRKLPRA